ncbi:hypothetical protein WDU94_003479 [Cyamophila willieti]
MRLLQQVFQTGSAPQTAPSHSHGRPAVRVYVLWQGVPPESGSQSARPPAYGRKAVSVCALRRAVPSNDNAKLHMRKHLCEAISSGNYSSPVLGSAQYQDLIKLMGQRGVAVPPGGEMTSQQAASALSQHIQQQQQNGLHTSRGPGRPRGSINPTQHSGDMNLYYVERPHACKFCSKCFKQEAHLKLHIRTHSDYRPFACTYCGKCFRLKAILNQHLRLHTGEKPYECETCGEKFRQMTTLKLHMRKHLAEVALSGGQLANQAEYAEVIGLIQKDSGGEGERAVVEVAHSQGQLVNPGQSSGSSDGVNI